MSKLTVAPDRVVSIRYELRDDKGAVLDSSEGEALAYLHGHDNIVDGLEAALTGLGTGDRREVVVEPADGYGEREGEPHRVSRSMFPADEPLEAGMQFVGEEDDGSLFPFWIAKVERAHVWVDRNHPLAGVRLHFAVEVTGVREATPEELEHGHPHGAGGHHH
jgi:FKBP-type peptidyl-prolyl cis-trans isomerase SlyD